MELNESYYSEKMMKKILNYLQADVIFSCLKTKKDKAEVIIAIANNMIEFANNLIAEEKGQGKM